MRDELTRFRSLVTDENRENLVNLAPRSFVIKFAKLASPLPPLSVGWISKFEIREAWLQRGPRNSRSDHRRQLRESYAEFNKSSVFLLVRFKIILLLLFLCRMPREYARAFAKNLIRSFPFFFPFPFFFFFFSFLKIAKWGMFVLGKLR